jgi:hypothetical protein
MTNREVTLANTALEELLQEKLDIGVSWKLANISILLTPIVEQISRLKSKLHKDYKIQQTQQGDRFTLKANTPEELKQFSDDINALLDQEVSIADVKKVKLPSTLQIKGATLVALKDFVEVQEEETTKRRKEK